MAAEITNDTLAEDYALSQALYQRLLQYYEDQSAADRCHPFLVETLADYTDDSTQALHFYQEALAMSRKMSSDEPTQTILIGIGEPLLETGRREDAEAFLRDGRAEAVRRADSYGIEEADRLLQDGSVG